jgi:hypothetical protein
MYVYSPSVVVRWRLGGSVDLVLVPDLSFWILGRALLWGLSIGSSFQTWVVASYWLSKENLRPARQFMKYWQRIIEQNWCLPVETGCCSFM